MNDPVVHNRKRVDHSEGVRINHASDPFVAVEPKDRITQNTKNRKSVVASTNPER